MSTAPYETTPTRWRSFPDLGDDDGAEPEEESSHLGTAFDRGWLPVAANEYVTASLDFAPGPRGVAGQVLLQVTECD